MIIDNIEYESIYYKCKTDFVAFPEVIECLICQKKINHNEEYYYEKSIFFSDKNDGSFDYETSPFPICINCVKTVKQAEKIAISLLRILYGGKMKIKRYVKNDSFHKEYWFYY